MIKFNETKEQPDLFDPDKQLAIVVESENTIDGNKTKMRVLPSHLPEYKDKVIRAELIRTVKRLISARHNSLMRVDHREIQGKWVAVNFLVDLMTKDTISLFKTPFAVSNYINKHLMHWLEAVIPGKASRYYVNYVKDLTALRTYTKQQILAHQRSREIVHFKEKELRV